MIKSLKARGSKLANIKNQFEVLSAYPFDGELPTFKDQLKKHNSYPLQPGKIDIMQINLGYMCNQVCKHCHVDAGPDRKEIMTKDHLLRCLEILKSTKIPSLDLTGGAPEMNPNFRWFVEEANKVGVKEIIVRSNLTIIQANKSYKDLPLFFKENGVRVISSLPYYQAGKTDAQRGDGVFAKSIKSLNELNDVGYGLPGS